jgi:hypothetical protein
MPSSSWACALIASLHRVANHVLNGQPVRQAARLAARLVGARAMSVVTLIVAAWMVDIEAFAEFGVYQTLATLAWIALFLRYDTAILAAPTDDEAGEVLRLCVVVGSVLWLVFAGICIAISQAGLMRMQLVLLLPFSIFARGMLRLAFATATRDGDFKGMGRASVVQSITQPTVLVLLVVSQIDDALCFAVADIVGHASGVAYLTWRRRHHFDALWQGWSGTALLAAAQRWKRLPLYNLPSSFLSLAFVLSPLLVMPFAADAVFAGQVALAYRMFDVPTQIVMAASTPIFLNRLRPSTGQANRPFGRHIMLGFMTIVGSGYVLMAGLFVLADPWLEASALAHLSDVIPMVALFQLFIALAAPLDDSCALYPQQKWLAVIQAAALLGGLFAALASLMISPEGVLLSLAVVSGFRTIVLGELLRHMSRMSRQTFLAGTLRSGRPAP